MFKYGFGTGKNFNVPGKSIFAPETWRSAYEETKRELYQTYGTTYFDIAYVNKGSFESFSFRMRIDNMKFCTSDVRSKLCMSWNNEIKYEIHRNKLLNQTTLTRNAGYDTNYLECMGVEGKIERVITSPMELLADMRELHTTRETNINAWYLKNRNMNMDLAIEYGETCDTIVTAFEAEGFTCTRRDDTTCEYDATRNIRVEFYHKTLFMEPDLRICIYPSAIHKLQVYCCNDFTKELVAKMMTGYYREGRCNVSYDSWVKFKTYEEGMAMLKAIPKVFRKVGESMQFIRSHVHPYQPGEAED